MNRHSYLHRVIETTVEIKSNDGWDSIDIEFSSKTVNARNLGEEEQLHLCDI